MSFQPYHPSRFGVLVPENLRTGVQDPDRAFYFDQVTSVSVDYPREVTQQPFEDGSQAATDNRTDGSPVVQVAAVLVDKPLSEGPQFYPLPFQTPDRCLRRLREFLALRQLNTTVAASLPGQPPWVRMLVGRASAVPRPNGAAIDVTFELRQARIVRLRTAAAIPDADLKAAGLGLGDDGVVQVGTLGGYGST